MVFIGSWMDFRPKKANLDHLGPPRWGHFGPFYPQSGQKGTQKQPKNAVFSRIFFCSKSFLKGSWMVSRPQKPLETCIGPAMDPILGHFTHKTAQNDPPKRVFLEYFCGPKMAQNDQKTYFGPISGYISKFYTVFILVL